MYKQENCNLNRNTIKMQVVKEEAKEAFPQAHTLSHKPHTHTIMVTHHDTKIMP